MDESVEQHVKNIIEALMFISEKPLMMDQIKEIIEGLDSPDVQRVVESLKKEYEVRKSGMQIVEIAGGFQMLTNPDYALYVKKFYRTKHKEKLSKPALETLAIVAYKQPVSRLDIELIRGVNSDGVVLHLLDKGLIKIVGRKDVPGKPYLYGTTRQFLEYFGLKSLDDLPKLEDFASLQPAHEGILPVEDENNTSGENKADSAAPAQVQGTENAPPSAASS